MKREGCIYPSLFCETKKAISNWRKISQRRFKNLFHDYISGIYSQQQLVNMYRLKGLNVSKTSIGIILSNILYAGYVDLEKHKISPFLKIKGLHQAIISEEVFNKAQDVKNGRNRMIKKIRPMNPDFPLSGLYYVLIVVAKCMVAKATMERVKKLLENIHITDVQKTVVNATAHRIFIKNYRIVCQN